MIKHGIVHKSKLQAAIRQLEKKGYPVLGTRPYPEHTEPGYWLVTWKEEQTA